MSIVISTVNQKGGVAKTTSTVNIAHGLSLQDLHVLIADLDPQGHCATALAVNPEPGIFNILVNPTADIHQWIRQTGRTGLDLLPGDRSTATAQIVLNAENRPISSIYQLLAPLAKEYDYIICDTAPSVGGIQERVVWASNLVLVPTATEFLPMDGLAQTMEMFKELRTNKSWGGALFGILPTFADDQTNESKKSLADLRQAFGEYILSPIHRATVLRECAAEGKTIFEKDPASRASREYTELCREIAKRS